MPVLDLPTPGDDEDVWGEKLNVAIATLNAYVDALGAGPPGPPGADGEDGADGADGPPGPPGMTTYEDLPPWTCVVMNWTGSAWPARPTSRADIVVRWRGPAAALPLPGDSLDVDEFVLKP